MPGTVIVAKVYQHKITGERRSPYSAFMAGEVAQFELITTGYTIAHPDGTVGIGRLPFKTAEEAQAWIDKHPNFSGMNQG